MRLMRWTLPALAAALTLSGSAFGQSGDNLDITLFQPQIDVSAESFPNRDFDTQAGEYGSGASKIGLLVPLGSTHLRPQKSILGYQFLGVADFQKTTPDITFLNDNHHLTTGTLAVAGLALTQSKNLVIGAAGVSFGEDEAISGSPSYRFWGGAAATHKMGKKSTLLYGGAVTYTFGRGLALPIIGAIWRLNQKWSLTAFAPFYVVAGYTATDNVTFRIRTGPAGNVFRFSNDNQSEFTSEPDVVYLKIVQWRTTGEIEWKASKNVTLMAEAGSVTTAKFAFSDNARGEHPFFDDKTAEAPYARFAARFRFGKTILDEWPKP